MNASHTKAWFFLVRLDVTRDPRIVRGTAKPLSCALPMMGSHMSAHIKFSPELGQWITHNLNRGSAAQDLVQSMVGQKFDPTVAAAIVDTFLQARASGQPAPVDAIEWEGALAHYQYETPRMDWSAACIRTFDRAIPVLLRLQQPVVAVLGSVLSHEECDQLMAMARTRLRPSTVADPMTGKNIEAEYRDSEGMFFRLNETPFIATLDRRIAELMRCPVEHGEGLQVLRYGPGARTTPHYDYLQPSSTAHLESIARSGNRISTLVVYLNQVAHGGETVFPEIGLAVSAQKGNAVYFEYGNSLRQADPKSLHAGAAVHQGEKWALTKWMRERPFRSA